MKSHGTGLAPKPWKKLSSVKMKYPSAHHFSVSHERLDLLRRNMVRG